MPELTTAPDAAISADDILLVRDGAAVGLKKTTVAALKDFIAEDLEIPTFPDTEGEENNLVVVNAEGDGFDYVPPADVLGIPEAPDDGEMYVRQSKAWEVLPDAGDTLAHVFLSQEDYDAIGTPDNDTLYYTPVP